MVEQRVFTCYEHKETSLRIAYVGASVSNIVRAMCRRRRRIMNAIDLIEFTSFLTLTYDDKLIPREYSSVFEYHASKHMTVTLGRIKAYFKKYDIPKFSYVWVVEYGELKGRPHWHVLTNIDYYNSVLHEKLPSWWGRGFVKVKQINNNYHAGKYVSKYMVKQEVDAKVKRYGTSQDIPATPPSMWKRVGLVLESELKAEVDDHNDSLNRGSLMDLDNVNLKENMIDKYM